MLFGRKSKYKFGLNVKPKDYGDLNKPLPDEIPRPNIGCGIHTEMCQGLIFSWIVTHEQAMDYDDVAGTIAAIRQYARHALLPRRGMGAVLERRI